MTGARRLASLGAGLAAMASLSAVGVTAAQAHPPVASSAVMSAATADDTTVGTVDQSYAGASAPTGMKPQSKLWIADGIWWGSLFDTASRDYHIFRYYWGVDRWVDTGVLIDERASAHIDTLWDGTHLYVATAGPRQDILDHRPRIMRYTYHPDSQTWTRDLGFPISLGDGGVEAVVMDKDSTGLLWVTYTYDSQVWVTHSTPGRDDVWVTPYVLPMPGSEAQVTPDDISAVVAYDGDKIGVLFSNQRTMVMYWAYHVDGTSDRSWQMQAAYDSPEGADDHIALRSIVGDDAGRVFAVAKTSKNKAGEPLINLLVLSKYGTWSATPFGTTEYNQTRAILEIDPVARQLYVFAAAPCCAGGKIYYQATSLDHPSFAPGLGTVFISDPAHPELNNPTSTKQPVSAATGLVVLAGDDQTHTYMHNRLTLDGGPGTDTDPPDTIIDSASVTSPDATFTFHSTEPGSSLTCRLDGGAATACTSPWQYTGLAAGQHHFEVWATDPAGNVDQSPAVTDWTLSPSGGTLLADDFSSGGFAAGGWRVDTGADGTASVTAGAVRPGDLGAELHATTLAGSTASLYRKLDTTHPTLSISWSARLSTARTTQSIALLKVYDDQGKRVLSLSRDGAEGLQLVDRSSTRAVTAMPINQATDLKVTLTPGADGGQVTVWVDGAVALNVSGADLGTRELQALRLGDDSVRRVVDLGIDDVLVES